MPDPTDARDTLDALDGAALDTLDVSDALDMPGAGGAGDTGQRADLAFYVRHTNALIERFGYCISEEMGLCAMGRSGPYAIMQAIPMLVRSELLYDTPDTLGAPLAMRDMAYLVDFHPILGFQGLPERAHIEDTDARDARNGKWVTRLATTPRPESRQYSKIAKCLNTLAIVEPSRQQKILTSGGLLQEDGRLLYVNPLGGVLTGNGARLDDSAHVVTYPDKLHQMAIRYGYLAPSTDGDAARLDFDALLRLGDVAPGAPALGPMLLGQLGLAPFSQATNVAHVLVYGTSGSFKSAVARLALQTVASDVYGINELSTVSLRDGKGTNFGVSVLLYHLPGTLALLDDAMQSGMDSRKISAQYALLGALASSQVSRQGSTRGTWNRGDAGLGSSPYPRATLLATVECLPESDKHASDLARWAICPLELGMVDVAALTEMQEQDAGAARNRAHAGYITWALNQWPTADALSSELARRIGDAEIIYREAHAHVRVTPTYARLDVGIGLLLDYGVSLGVLTPDEADATRSTYRAALLKAIAHQTMIMGVTDGVSQANDPVHIFYDLLARALRERRIFLSAPYRRAIGADGPTNTDDLRAHQADAAPPDNLPDGFRLADLGWVLPNGADTWQANGVEIGTIRRAERDDAGRAYPLPRYIARMSTTRHFNALYDALEAIAKRDDKTIPGRQDMINRLIERRVLIRLGGPRRLWGRNDTPIRCFDLDTTTIVAPDDDSAADALDALDADQEGKQDDNFDA